MKGIGAYRTADGQWAAYDKAGRTWRVTEAEARALEEARASAEPKGKRRK